jgi:nicotinamidase-related amidase
MQTDVVRGRWWSWWPDIERVVDNCVDLVATCRGMGIPVVFTRVEYAADGSNTPKALSSGIAEATEYLIEGTAGVEFVPEFTPQQGELDAVKNMVSAFEAAGVPTELDRLGIDTILVAGLAIEGGVNATVHDPVAENFDMIVVSDCVAAFSEAAFNERMSGTFPPLASIMTRGDAILAASEASGSGPKEEG